jgi:putative flippase GtrA
MQQRNPSSPASFIAVGSSAAGVHLLVAWAIVESGWAAPAWANVSAFACAFMVSFLGHRRYTFGTAERLPANLAKWLAVSIAGFALNQTLYVAALHLFPQVFYLLLLFAVTAMIAVASYCLGRFWAFAPIA